LLTEKSSGEPYLGRNSYAKSLMNCDFA